MSIADTLRAGKANIEARGWCQGDGKVFDPLRRYGFCVGSSLGPVTFDNPEMTKVCDMFKIANGISLLSGLGDWNDAPERTKEEVLAAFDKAIALAEQESA